MELEMIVATLPREAWAAVAGLFGWLAALTLRWGVAALLKVVRFDTLAERVGLASFLKTGQVPYSASRLVGIAAYWLALLTTLVGVSVLLDAALVASVSDRLRDLAPGLVAAFLVAVMGLMLVSFVANFVLTLARNACWVQSRLVSRIVRGLGIVLVLGVALEQVGFNMSLLHSFLLILAGGVTLGLALAFGLGGQDLARQALKGWIASLSERDRKRGPDLEG